MGFNGGRWFLGLVLEDGFVVSPVIGWVVHKGASLKFALTNGGFCFDGVWCVVGGSKKEVEK